MGLARQLRACHRVDMNHHDIGAVAVIDQGVDGGVAHIAAVPIGFAVDFHRLKQKGQAGGGEHGISGDLRFLEHLDLAGAHIGGGQEQLDRRLPAQAIEIHRLLEHAAKRVEVVWVELIGRKHPGQQIESVKGW